jgi:hypothetical protein
MTISAARMSALRMVFVMMTSISASALAISFAIKRIHIAETVPIDVGGHDKGRVNETNVSAGRIGSRSRSWNLDRSC